jgi:hypothetical protein
MLSCSVSNRGAVKRLVLPVYIALGHPNSYDALPISKQNKLNCQFMKYSTMNPRRNIHGNWRRQKAASQALHNEIRAELAGWRELLAIVRRTKGFTVAKGKAPESIQSKEEDEGHFAFEARRQTAERQTVKLQQGIEKLASLIGGRQSDEEKLESCQMIQDRLQLHVLALNRWN